MREVDVVNAKTLRTLRDGRQRAIALPAAPPSSMTARAFAHDALQHWQLADLSDDVRLIVAELVTNAMLHATGPINLILDLRDQGVRVEVIDESPTMPTTPPPSMTGTNGRGLAIVAALSCEWGVDRLPTGGKSIWADISRDL